MDLTAAQTGQELGMVFAKPNLITNYVNLILEIVVLVTMVQMVFVLILTIIPYAVMIMVTAVWMTQ